MTEMIVTNSNIIVETRGGGAGRRQRDGVLRQANPQRDRLAAEVERKRRQLARLACTSTWAEDCLYRSATYVPDFVCACPACRTKFPDRRHPRPARETDISSDCQAEREDDPEFAQELALLRGDPERIGSVLRRHTPNSGSKQRWQEQRYHQGRAS